MILALTTTLLLAAPQQTAEGFPGLGAGRAPQVEIPWNRLYYYP